MGKKREGKGINIYTYAHTHIHTHILTSRTVDINCTDKDVQRRFYCRGRLEEVGGPLWRIFEIVRENNLEFLLLSYL